MISNSIKSTSVQENHNRLVPLLAMIYMMQMLAALVLVYKPILVGNFTTTAAGLVSPFGFVLGDIIAEVYGYNVSKWIIIYGLIGQFLFCLIVTRLMHWPSPITWKEQHCFNYVMRDFLKIYFTVLAGHLIANLTNIYLISKWKTLLKGKYFWLRSIGASGIGEFVYSIITATMINWGIFYGKELVICVSFVCLFKWLGTIILAPIANLVVFILKKIERKNINAKIQINPFQGV